MNKQDVDAGASLLDHSDMIDLGSDNVRVRRIDGRFTRHVDVNVAEPAPPDRSLDRCRRSTHRRFKPSGRPRPSLPGNTGEDAVLRRREHGGRHRAFGAVGVATMASESADEVFFYAVDGGNATRFSSKPYSTRRGVWHVTAVRRSRRKLCGVSTSFAESLAKA